MRILMLMTPSLFIFLIPVSSWSVIFFPDEPLSILLLQLQHWRSTLDPLLNGTDMLGSRNILRHGPADPFDRLAYLASDHFVGVNRLLLMVDPLAGQFVPCLGHAKLVGGEFGGVHAVEQIFFLGNPLALLDRLVAKTVV